MKTIKPKMPSVMPKLNKVVKVTFPKAKGVVNPLRFLK